jgi:hypothetical protein
MEQFTQTIIAVALAFALLLPTTSVSAKTTAAANPPAQPPAVSEVAVLKAQLATMQSFTDGLLATVYWSLGAVVVLTVFLIGFNWFSSARMHQRDIAAIRSELEGTISTQAATLRGDLEKLASEKLKEISSASADHARQTTSGMVAPIQSELGELSKSIRGLQTKLEFATLQSEAWYWHFKDVKSNEFRYYQQILSLAEREKDPVQIATCLKKLSNLLAEGTKIHIIDITSLKALLDRLPSEYAIQAETLQSALRTAKTY